MRGGSACQRMAITTMQSRGRCGAVPASRRGSSQCHRHTASGTSRARSLQPGPSPYPHAHSPSTSTPREKMNSARPTIRKHRTLPVRVGSGGGGSAESWAMCVTCNREPPPQPNFGEASCVPHVACVALLHTRCRCGLCPSPCSPAGYTVVVNASVPALSSNINLAKMLVCYNAGPLKSTRSCRFSLALTGRRCGIHAPFVARRTLHVRTLTVLCVCRCPWRRRVTCPTGDGGLLHPSVKQRSTT